MQPASWDNSDNKFHCNNQSNSDYNHLNKYCSNKFHSHPNYNNHHHNYNRQCNYDRPNSHYCNSKANKHNSSPELVFKTSNKHLTESLEEVWEALLVVTSVHVSSPVLME